MAQTTSHMSGVNSTIEVSSNGTTWVAIGGTGIVTDPGEQSGDVGEEYTYEGMYALLATGKKKAFDITVKIVYTSTVGEAWQIVRTAWETADRILYLRYSPSGGGTGASLLTTTQGRLSGLTPPKTDTGDAKPLTAGFKLRVARLIESTL